MPLAIILTVKKKKKTEQKQIGFLIEQNFDFQSICFYQNNIQNVLVLKLDILSLSFLWLKVS